MSGDNKRCHNSILLHSQGIILFISSTDNKGDKDTTQSSGDGDAPVNKPLPVSSAPTSLWITAREATASNTLADSVYKSFTSSSLLRVLMHTTQPMFNGNTFACPNMTRSFCLYTAYIVLSSI